MSQIIDTSLFCLISHVDILRQGVTGPRLDEKRQIINLNENLLIDLLEHFKPISLNQQNDYIKNLPLSGVSEN